MMLWQGSHPLPFWKYEMNPLGVKGQNTDLKISHMLKYDVAMPHTNFVKKYLLRYEIILLVK